MTGTWYDQMFAAMDRIHQLIDEAPECVQAELSFAFEREDIPYLSQDGRTELSHPTPVGRNYALYYRDTPALREQLDAELRAKPVDPFGAPTVEFYGLPLSDVGLDCAVIRHADGKEEPFRGFMVRKGQTIYDAVVEHVPKDAVLYHDWSKIPVKPEDFKNALETASFKVPTDEPWVFPEYLHTGGVATGPGIREDEIPAVLPTAFQKSQQNQTSSEGRLWGKSVIHGKEDEHDTPYMTRYWIGPLRLHVFHRGDQDPDCHDHPWDFWTFPLTSYVEEVLTQTGQKGDYDADHRKLESHVYARKVNVVPAFRLTRRKAEHCHRVLGKYTGRRKYADAPRIAQMIAHPEPIYGPGNIVTIVWRGRSRRPWGFLKCRDGKWCWVAWRDYVFGGGKSAPCE